MEKQEAKQALQKAQTNSDTLQVQSTAKTIEETFQKLLPQIANASLKKIPAEFVVSTAMTVLRGDSKLRECDPLSLIHCVLQSAQTGLRLDPTLQQAALIPRYNKEKRRLEAQFMPMYRGLLALVRRSGEVIHVAAQPVYACDEFSYEYGTDQRLTHKPDVNRKPNEDIVAFYAYVKLRTGGFQFEVMTFDEVQEFKEDALRDKNNKGASPWTTDFVPMGCKTVLKRLTKLLPIEDVTLSTVVKMDDLIEREIPQSQDIVDGLVIPTGSYRDDPGVGVPIPTSSPASPGAEAQSESPQDRPVVASGSATTNKGGWLNQQPAIEAKTPPTRSSKESEDRIPWVKTCLDVIPLLIEKQNRNGAADWYKRARAKFEAGEITEAQFKEIEAKLVAGFPPKQVVGEQAELPIGGNTPKKRGHTAKAKTEPTPATVEPSPDQAGKSSDEFIEKISKAERLSVLMGIKSETEKAFAANKLTPSGLKIVIKFLDEKWDELKKKNQISK